MASDVALVTGGTGALGRAVVAELLTAGDRVVATWRTASERDDAAAELGSPAGLTFVEADLLEPDGIQATVGAATGAGRLRSVVNVAGGFAMGGVVHEAPENEFDRMLDLNLRTAHRVTRAALPSLLDGGGGAIVCVGAQAARQPFSGASAYITAKAAVVAFVRALDADYRDRGVRANAVLPSVIDTPANRKAMPDTDPGDWVDPAEIARVVAFLCSEAAAATSGAAVPVDGPGR